MAVSRKREFLADATGAQFTRNPMALASALQKLEAASSPTKAITRGAAHLCIVDPAPGLFSNRKGFLADTLASHPPIGQRISRLEAMAYGGAPPPPAESSRVVKLAGSNGKLKHEIRTCLPSGPGAPPATSATTR